MSGVVRVLVLGVCAVRVRRTRTRTGTRVGGGIIVFVVVF